jgi:GH24 family phage-related lysozyme (muramidase)
MRHVTNAGLALIKRFESFSPTVYVCPAGYPTISYGNVVLDGERERFSGGVNEDEADALLRRDAGIAERAVLRLIAVPLTDGRFDALCSFAFNLGGGALQRSTLRRKVNREEHALVPAEIMKWIWAGGRKLKGLVRRREAEAALYAEHRSFSSLGGKGASSKEGLSQARISAFC